MRSSYEVLPLFEEFISDTRKGKRRKANGAPLSIGTVKNYETVLRLLQAYEEAASSKLTVRVWKGFNKRLEQTESAYWKRFFKRFSEFVYKRGGFDNYLGMVIKTLKTFFKYLKKEKHLPIGDFISQLYVFKEDIPVIALSPERVRYLIYDTDLRAQLNAVQLKALDIFIFGCAVGLRFSDLVQVSSKDIKKMEGAWYLSSVSKKTKTASLVRLPDYAIDIVKKYQGRSKRIVKLFKAGNLHAFNTALRSIGEVAGWTEVLGKQRTRNGKTLNVTATSQTRFCDLMSSHLMRRSAITTMLLAGMPEHLVRKISGHATNSPSFYRYVNYTQPFLDQAIEKMHDLLKKQ